MANVWISKCSLGPMLHLERGHCSSPSLTSYTLGDSNPVSTLKCNPSLVSNSSLKTRHDLQHPVWSASAYLSISIPPHSALGSPCSSPRAPGLFPWLGYVPFHLQTLVSFSHQGRLPANINFPWTCTLMVSWISFVVLPIVAILQLLVWFLNCYLCVLH